MANSIILLNIGKRGGKQLNRKDNHTNIDRFKIKQLWNLLDATFDRMKIITFARFFVKPQTL